MRRAPPTNGTGGTQLAQPVDEARFAGEGSFLQEGTTGPQGRGQQAIADGLGPGQRRRQQQRAPGTDAPAARNAAESKQHAGLGAPGPAGNRAGGIGNRRGALEQPGHDRIGPGKDPQRHVAGRTGQARRGVDERALEAAKDALVRIGGERGDSLCSVFQVLPLVVSVMVLYWLVYRADACSFGDTRTIHTHTHRQGHNTTRHDTTQHTPTYNNKRCTQCFLGSCLRIANFFRRERYM
mmetsp:Transcript_17293/g.35544  ORF Transcript_17293/g.35544 Transcript_17293/m.35544 type:complete len:238 (-) Transcript_17293:502-1215(-)